MTDTVWRGNESLRPLLTPILELKPHPRNPRRHDLQAIAASLSRFGQQRPVLCLPNKMIVAGHGTTMAAGDLLGWTHVAVVSSDLTDDEIDGYLLADNRTADLGYYEQSVLAEVLSDMQEKGKLEGTGYTTDDVDEALSAAVDELAEQERAAGATSDGAAQQERRRIRESGSSTRELPLVYGDEQFEKLEVSLRILGREWGIDGISEIVYEAVTRSAKAI